jgi:hypothetical protein
MSLFAPKLGCPMCSITQAAAGTQQDNPTSPLFRTSLVSQPEILWQDDNFTAYLKKNNPVSSKGHIIILFKQVSDHYQLQDNLTFYAPQFACSIYLFTGRQINYTP